MTPEGQQSEMLILPRIREYSLKLRLGTWAVSIDCLYQSRSSILASIVLSCFAEELGKRLNWRLLQGSKRPKSRDSIFRIVNFLNDEVDRNW
jgi:hypothetical protein